MSKTKTMITADARQRLLAQLMSYSAEELIRLVEAERLSCKYQFMLQCLAEDAATLRENMKGKDAEVLYEFFEETLTRLIARAAEQWGESQKEFNGQTTH